MLTTAVPAILCVQEEKLQTARFRSTHQNYDTYSLTISGTNATTLSICCTAPNSEEHQSGALHYQYRKRGSSALGFYLQLQY
jgi:exonuclease III